MNDCVLRSEVDGQYVRTYSNTLGTIVWTPYKSQAMVFEEADAARYWAKRYAPGYKVCAELMEC